MRKFLLIAGAAAIFTLGACKEQQQEQASDTATPPQVETTENIQPAEEISFPLTVYYQCEATFVEFTLHNEEKADMRIANVSYAMKRAISASGAKYENLGDPETYLWSKGKTAMLRINGVDSPECVETTAPPKPVKPYRASGNEPGWTALLETDKAQLDLTLDYADVAATLPVTADTRDGSTRTVTASDGVRNATMTIVEKSCQDDMSGEAFAHEVTVTFSDKTYQGCGQSLIRGVTWKLEDINNEGIVDDSHITATFDYDARVYGKSGCNNYNGGYTLEGKNIDIGENMASTMMACLADSLMQQERKYLQTLSAMKNAVVDETGALILSGDDGKRLLFRAEE